MERNSRLAHAPNFGVWVYFSCLATLISYKGDKILRLPRLVFKIWRGGQTDDRHTDDRCNDRFRDIATFVLHHAIFSHPPLPKISPCFRGSRWVIFGLWRAKILDFLFVQLVSKIFNLCGHDPPTSQTDKWSDGQTTCNSKTTLCTVVHRVVKSSKFICSWLKAGVHSMHLCDIWNIRPWPIKPIFSVGCPIMEFGEAIKNPAYRIFQTEYSGCLDISAHA